MFVGRNFDELNIVVSSYVWEKINIGYIQGMCDLCAPLLVIMDDGNTYLKISSFKIIVQTIFIDLSEYFFKVPFNGTNF